MTVDIESLLKKHSEKTTELIIKQLQIDEELFKSLTDMVREVLNIYPELKGVTWTQYVPYFNDGDECVFSVNEPELILNREYNEFEDEYSVLIDEEQYPKIASYELGEWHQSCERILTETEENWIRFLNNVSSITSSIEPFLQEKFGSHSEVIVLSDRIIVEEYHHD